MIIRLNQLKKKKKKKTKKNKTNKNKVHRNKKDYGKNNYIDNWFFTPSQPRWSNQGDTNVIKKQEANL